MPQVEFTRALAPRLLQLIPSSSSSSDRQPVSASSATQPPHPPPPLHPLPPGSPVSATPCPSSACPSCCSTPCELVSPSPTVLLSPVLLSRPIRSASAHSPNFIRSASAAGAHQSNNNNSNPSDSESELATVTPMLCCSSASRQSHSRLSHSGGRPSASSSPLATPPPLLCSSPIPTLPGGGGAGNSRNVSRSGSFSRHQLLHHHHPPLHLHHHHSSGTHSSASAPKVPSPAASVPIARCHSFSRCGAGGRKYPQHQKTFLQHQGQGTFSHNDSFESSASAGEHFPHAFSPSSSSASYAARRISGCVFSAASASPPVHSHHNHPLLAGRPPSAAAQLQRSHSDALDPSLSRHSSAGGRGCLIGSPGGGGIAILGERLLGISAARGTKTPTGGASRRPSTSLRDLQQNDLLHSSLDSSGSYQQHFPSGAIHLHRHQSLSRPGAPCASGVPSAPHHLHTNFQLFQHLSSALHSSSSPSANLMRLRLCPLGHSDPQIYTYTQSHANCGASPGRYSAATGGRRSFLSSSPQTHKIRKESFLCGPSSNVGASAIISKQLLHAGGGSPCSSAGAPDLLGARKSPVQMRMHRSSFSSMGSGYAQHGGVQASSSHHHHGPSGHGHHPHGASSSARPSISAGCSGIRQPVALRALPPGHHLENRRWSLASLPSSSGYGTPGTNSAFSSQYSSQENLAGLVADMRISNRFDSNESYCLGDDFGGLMRPRSRSLASPVRIFDQLGVDAPMMSLVYKERFPKAKQQLEKRLQQFLLQNAPLSGFNSQLLQLNILAPNQTTTTSTQLRPISPQQTIPRPNTITTDRPPSPCRSQSPLPMRPLSPLVTESATAIGDTVIRSSAHFSSSQQMLAPSQQQETDHPTPSSLHRSSMCSPVMLATSDPALLRLISDGATRFLHHQLCEIAADCLQKSRDGLLSCAYFCNMSVRLDETLAEAEIKVGPDSYNYLTRLVKQILMIVSRAARLLECLEFDPDEFYQLLEEAEGAVRVQLGSGSARVPDLPQYIVTKLGLNKNLQLEHAVEDEEEAATTLGPISPPGEHDPERTPLPAEEAEGKRRAETVGKAPTPAGAPKEEDFESVRLISNGAYGAVYLVKHRRTHQRFALKKMKKQTLILRNQIEQVYAERDILTFTDNPFVVCFYGSFETKQHLCMLMEYVEGGDCASLLKSASTLPIELARLYVAETVLAIEYLHSCGIVHRDLKPDNLLITSMGHIKLTDFGLSKIGLMNRTTLVSEGYMMQDDTQQFKDNQLCGTPEYIAPEVILRQGYGKPVDWWALGVILYEFLVGIVPFLGDTPEALFANIINEDVEYPEGDEALDADAESLVRMLLEKNPVDRLGTVGGAPQVSAHPFFAPLDFDTILRQKAEFVPQLENDEDTSYFDSRTDRYNHDANESAEDDESVPMFWSFSTASPRHSIVGLELPVGGMAMLQAAHAAAIERGQDMDDERVEMRERLASSAATSSSGIGSGANSAFGPPPQPAPSSRILGGNYSDSQDSQASFDHHRPHQKQQLSVGGKEFPGDVIPSAVILRRRFSNQRHTNVSTSSSGTTTGTGPGVGSSTDSSLDASHFEPRRSQGQLPRLAISPCALNSATNAGSQREGSAHLGAEHLSPVDERRAAGIRGGGGVPKRMEKRPSAVVHELITDANRIGQPLGRQSRSSSCRSTNNPVASLKVHIPGQHILSASSSAGVSPQQGPSSTTTSSSQATTYYHSYAGGGATLSAGTNGSPGQISPSCNSVSSVSSFDSQQNAQQNKPSDGHGRPSALCSPSLLPPPAISSSSVPSHHRTSISGGNSRPIVIRKGAQGFGFTIRSVRVYLSQASEYYSIEHIVAAVREASPAWEAGLRPNDLITHVHTQSVHNMTHPELMRRLLSCGNELTVHVVPLSSTSIKEGEPRRNIGKPLRKKPRRPAQQKGKQQGRKNSALLRRLSGKRATGDIVPGSSSQKQTFMPRSVSSQEGVLITAGPSATVAQQQPPQQSRQFLGPSDHQHSAAMYSANTKRLSIPAGSELLCPSPVSPLAAGSGALTVAGGSLAASPTPTPQPPKSPLVSASTSAKQSSTTTGDNNVVKGKLMIQQQQPKQLVATEKRRTSMATTTVTASTTTTAKPVTNVAVSSSSSSSASSIVHKKSSSPPMTTKQSQPQNTATAAVPPPQHRASTLQSIKQKVHQHLMSYAGASSGGGAPASSDPLASAKNRKNSDSTGPSESGKHLKQHSVDNPSSGKKQSSATNISKHQPVGSTASTGSNTQQRSPSPGRRVSPSRLMHRFFRS